MKRGKKKEANGENGVIENEEGEAGGGGGGRESDGMTSYDEFQGEAAKDLIYEMLSKIENETGGNTNDDASAITTMTYDGFDIPLLPGAERLLVPFARFETRRTSWQFNTDDASLPSSSSSSMLYSGLKIDLDKTNFNYMVGEVEAVFTKEEGEDAVAVEAEKEKIRNLVDLLTAATATTAVERNGNNDDIGENSKGCMATTIGKLEFYMINNRRDHYDACVRAGVMMN